MKNAIVLFAFAALVLAACGTSSTEVTVPASDSSAVDSSACCAQVDSAVADSAQIVK